MIPILYDYGETSFTSNGIGRLKDAISCIVTEEKNGIYELEMEYDIGGSHYKDLELDRIIYAKPFANGHNQIFKIYEITKPINGKVKVYAEHISYMMRMIPVAPFTAVGPQAVLNGLKENALEECPFSFSTDLTEVKRYTLPYPAGMREKLQGDKWSILENFGGEYEYDNYNVILHESRGTDKGVVLRYGKNIKDLKQEENIQNTYTGIIPYWYGFVNEEQELVSIPTMYSENVDNFPYHRTIAIDFTEYITEKPTEEELYKQGEAYIKRNKIGVPSVSITLDFINLQDTEEYRYLEHLQDLNLCDTVEVIYEKLGVSTTAKINKTVYDVLNERYTKLSIGEGHHSLAVTIAEQESMVNALANGTMVAGQKNTLSSALSIVKYVSQQITGNIGGYIVLNDSDGDGEPDELLIMDSPTKSQARKVARWNMSGLAFSKEGYAGPYTTGMTIDGVIDASILSVINIVANNIQTGIITDQLGRNWWNLDTGEFHIGSSTQDQVDDLADELAAIQDTLSQYQSSSDGVTIDGGTTINNGILVTDTVTTRQTLQVGNHLWLARSNGTNTTLVYVGE